MVWFSYRLGRVAKAPAFTPSPRTGVLGQSPKFIESFRGTSKILLALDHDQVEFLSTDPSGLQPPQIDHQLPADGHHGFFLQCPVSAPQDFDQLIVLSAGQTPLFLRLAGHPRQLQRVLIPIEVIEQLAG